MNFNEDDRGSMRKVLYITNLPVPYKIDFFNELGKYVDLTVAFERKMASNRDSEWLSSNIYGFKAVFLSGIKVGVEDGFCPGICELIRKTKYDDIIIGAYHTPTGMLATTYMKINRIPFFISTEGGFIKKDSTIKKAIKTFFMSGAKGYFSTGKLIDEYLVHYGAKENVIYRYPFSSICEQDILKSPLTKEEKKAFKNELGIKEEEIILGVGQFIERKGWDVLFEVAKILPDNIGIYIIGGKATEKYIQFKEKNHLKRLHFLEFKQKNVLKKYYYSADVFVLPTREDIWGLVVNEAMALGLPVITTDRCIAGLEMINQNKNGYIVPVNDANAVLKVAEDILFDYDKRINMGKNCLYTANEYTIEKMAKAFADILVINMGRR